MVEQAPRAFWVAEPGRGEIRAEPPLSAGAHEVLVRARYSGISRGTEALVFMGRVPVSEYSRMRAPFQAGEFPAPVKYGYSSVGAGEGGTSTGGRVDEGHRDWVGQRVFVLYPHQDRYVVPSAAVHAVPAEIPAG